MPRTPGRFCASGLRPCARGGVARRFRGPKRPGLLAGCARLPSAVDRLHRRHRARVPAVGHVEQWPGRVARRPSAGPGQPAAISGGKSSLSPLLSISESAPPAYCSPRTPAAGDHPGRCGPPLRARLAATSCPGHVQAGFALDVPIPCAIPAAWRGRPCTSAAPSRIWPGLGPRLAVRSPRPPLCSLPSGQFDPPGAVRKHPALLLPRSPGSTWSHGHRRATIERSRPAFATHPRRRPPRRRLHRETEYVPSRHTAVSPTLGSCSPPLARWIPTPRPSRVCFLRLRPPGGGVHAVWLHRGVGPEAAARFAVAPLRRSVPDRMNRHPYWLPSPGVALAACGPSRRRGKSTSTAGALWPAAASPTPPRHPTPMSSPRPLGPDKFVDERPPRS